jgi:hypothetical protein
VFLFCRCPFARVSSTLDFAGPCCDTATLGNAEAVSPRTGDALLMTEFGATNDPGILAGLGDQRQLLIRPRSA